MGKKTYQDNFRVLVEPKTWGYAMRDVEYARKELKSTCESIKADIERHVDDISQVYIDSDTIEECEFCGNRWTEGESVHNGGCCDEDGLIMEKYEDELEGK